MLLATAGTACVLPGRGSTLLDPPPPIGSRANELLDVLDPNVATAAELAVLPGIGPGKAEAILDHRNATDGVAFGSLDDLQNVSGIGPSTATKLRPYLLFPAAAGPAAN